MRSFIIPNGYAFSTKNNLEENSKSSVNKKAAKTQLHYKRFFIINKKGRNSSSGQLIYFLKKKYRLLCMRLFCKRIIFEGKKMQTDVEKVFDTRLQNENICMEVNCIPLKHFDCQSI